MPASTAKIRMTPRLAKAVLYPLLALVVTLGGICPVLAQSMTTMPPMPCHHEQGRKHLPQCCVGPHHQSSLPTAGYQLTGITAASISLDFSNFVTAGMPRVGHTDTPPSDSPPPHERSLRI